MPELQDAPALDYSLLYLWGWFTDLQAARQSTGFGLAPLSFAEIAHWRAETGTPPFLPFELEVLKGWDMLFLTAVANADKAKTKEGKT